MQRAIGIGLLCIWLGVGCAPAQEAPLVIKTVAEAFPDAAKAITTNQTPPIETPLVAPAVAEVKNDLASSNVSTQAETTNEVFISQTVPADLLPGIIARFAFDVDECSDPDSGHAIPVIFKREQPGYADGQPVPANKPRLVKGQFGRGLLLEDAHANLLSKNQAAVEGTTTSSFVMLKSTTMTFDTNDFWQGRQALQVNTPGADGEEGIALAVAAKKGFYDGQQIVPAHYVASVYLKGKGALMLSLKEPGSGTETEPTIINLDSKKWQRFFCSYPANFPVIDVGPGHEADWQYFIPASSKLELQLNFTCSTIDKEKTIFYADGFQVEQRALPFAAQGSGLSPRSWTLGGSPAAQDEFSFATPSDIFAPWKKSGTISFWFKPNWDARDGTQELLLYLGPAAIHLQHLKAKLRFYPAGVECSPYDWKNTWHHIAVTWNEDGRRTLFVDGYDYVNPQDEVRPMPDTTDSLALSVAGNGNSPNGVVDELILFQEELTLEQIKSIASYTPPATKSKSKSGK